MSEQAIDFLQPQRAPQVGWVLLSIGVAALAFALWGEQRWAAELAAAEDTERQARREAQDRLVPAPPIEATLAQRRWLQAQGELRRPWLPALRAIESATRNPVFLLTMNIDPSKGLIRLDAEAPSFDHALAYVQVLDIGGALEPATLISHEPSPNAPEGGGAVRFSVLTHWVAP